jgi:hypothetical protein
MRRLIFAYICCFYVAAHSWLHCVDYPQNAPLTVNSIQNNLCSAWPRGASSSLVFGLDIGLDYIPNDSAPCRFKPGSEYVLYEANKTYRILWPAKNHQSDACTNPYIPDTQLKLFFYPGELSKTDPPLSIWTENQFLIKDFRLNGKGFQNCPDFCSNTDKAPCFGEFSPPNVGYFKALWLWEFNKGQFYTSCFDVRVHASPSEFTTLPPTTRSPTFPPTTQPPTTRSPTFPPTTQPPTSCARQYQQCGGQGFSPVSCCGQLTCVRNSNWYSQCLAPSTCVGLFRQCGGRGYTGPTNCCDGSCKAFNELYSQCAI